MLLYNARILSMADKDYEKGYISIEEGLIKDIGSMADLFEPRGTDLSGYWILPGFIDASTRLGIHEDGSGPIGYDEDEEKSIGPELKVIDGLFWEDRAFYDALSAGVTTVLVEPGNRGIVSGQAAIVKTQGRVVRDRAALKISLAGRERMPGYLVYHRSRSEAIALFRQALGQVEGSEEEVLIEFLQGKIPGLFYAPYALDIANVMELAEEFGFKFIIEQAEEAYLLEGLEEVILGPFLLPKSGVRIRGSQKSPVLLEEKGVRFALSTSHPVLPVRYLLSVAGIAVGEGLTEETALKAITINPAEILGIADRVGSLEVSKDADLVVLDGNPFASETRVHKVMIDGLWVYDRHVDPPYWRRNA